MVFNQIRARVSGSLLRFAADRSLETHDLERRLSAADPERPGHDSALAAVAVARAWVSMVLWLAWRLQPRSTVEL
jgi:hypothetical protein